MTTKQAIARVDRAQLHHLSPDLVAAIRLLAKEAKSATPDAHLGPAVRTLKTYGAGR